MQFSVSLDFGQLAQVVAQVAEDRGWRVVKCEEKAFCRQVISHEWSDVVCIKSYQVIVSFLDAFGKRLLLELVLMGGFNIGRWERRTVMWVMCFPFSFCPSILAGSSVPALDIVAMWKREALCPVRCNIHWIDDANIGDWIRKARNLIQHKPPGYQHWTCRLSKGLGKSTLSGGALDANQSLSRRCLISCHCLFV